MENLNNETVINILINRRLLLGMNQSEFARKMSLSRQTVNRWETEQILPNAINFIKACKVLGLKIYDFFA